MIRPTRRAVFLFAAGLPLAMLLIVAAPQWWTVCLQYAGVTIAAMLADHFSGPIFGRVNGTMMMLFSLAGAAGPLATGYLFDRFGRYREAALLLVAIFLVSCLSAVAQGRLKNPTPETV